MSYLSPTEIVTIHTFAQCEGNHAAMALSLGISERIARQRVLTISRKAGLRKPQREDTKKHLALLLAFYREVDETLEKDREWQETKWKSQISFSTDFSI